MSNQTDTDTLLGEIRNVQIEILERLTKIDRRLKIVETGHAAVIELHPAIEALLNEILSFREDATASSSKAAKAGTEFSGRVAEITAGVAQVASDMARIAGGVATVARGLAFTHAAASGSHAPLPADVLADPMLERFLIQQPDPMVTEDQHSLAAWRATAVTLPATELASALERQYRVSPTDTDRSLALRFQMAAVARAELTRRGIRGPEAPASAVRPPLTDEARLAETARLAAILQGHREGICGEPELAPFMVVVEAERQLKNSLAPEMVKALLRMLERGQWPIEHPDQPIITPMNERQAAITMNIKHLPSRSAER